MSDSTPKLNGRQRRFAELRLSNPFVPIAELYRMAGYKAKNDNTANACGSRLLQSAKIIEYMFLLRREARKAIVAKAATWEELLMDARDYIEGVLDGRYVPDSEKLKAAIYVANRVEGMPVARAEVRTGTLKDTLDALDKGIAEIDERVASKELAVH